jgi:ABC-type sugar transport system ATPase subunit
MNNNPKVIIEMENISKHYPGVVALDNVNLAFYKPEIHALAGKNGAGKSTLIKILGGAVLPDSGKISINGREIFLNSPQSSIKQGISIINQELMLVPELSVVENILLGQFPTKGANFFDWSTAEKKVDRILSTLGLEIDPKTKVKKLSVAQMQIIEIAKALSRDSQIIVMDEPTSSLPIREVENLLNIVRKLKEEGRTVIYITHKLNEIFEITDRITVLRDGKKIVTLETENTDEREVVNHMVGQNEPILHHKHTVGKSDDPVLEVRNVSLKNKLSDISFTLHKGEILGIAGLLGSGRTELLQAIYGYYPILSGHIYVDGNMVNQPSVRKMIKEGIVLAPEDRKLQGLILSMNILDNINLANQNSIFRKKGAELNAANQMKNDMNIVTSSLKSLVSSLSGGNQQKIVLSKWMVTNPKIILLDEPTRGIDISSKYEIYRLIQKQAEKGVAFIVVSSEFSELLQICDRILVLSQGGVSEEGNADDFNEESLFLHASGLDTPKVRI